MITVKGGHKTQKKFIKQVADWASVSVLGPRLARVVDVNINIIRNLDADGWCIWEDEGVCGREFTIEVRAEQTYPEMLITICHEMIHVRQMARGELKEVGITRGGKHHYQVWKGKKISKRLAYAKHPWETEAYKLQDKYAKQYVTEGRFVYTNQMIARDRRIEK
jgi:hypothetical protein